jgi:hypothetical protein
MKLPRQNQAGRCLGEKDYRTAKSVFQVPRQKISKEVGQQGGNRRRSLAASP